MRNGADGIERGEGEISLNIKEGERIIIRSQRDGEEVVVRGGGVGCGWRRRGRKQRRAPMTRGWRK